MVRQDWVLMATQFSGKRGLSPVVLQKSLFLLGAELPGEVGINFYRFEPHNYGPFSKYIYQDAELLAEIGQLAIERNPNSYPLYCITGAGRDRVIAIEGEVSVRARNYLELVVQWAENLSFPRLISSIYEKYPAYRVNSVFNQ
jgi:hypothetical protein